MIISNGIALVENERENSFSLSLLRSANESARFCALTYLTRLLLLKQKEEGQKKEREGEREKNLRRTMHSHTFRAATHTHTFIHDKPCAVIEAV